MRLKLGILTFILLSLGSFAYAAAPTITSFTPSSGVYYTVVTITGANFTSPPTVFFNGTRAIDIWVNYTTITARVPAGASSGTISVTTASGTATSAGSFTIIPSPIPPPTINSFTPPHGAMYSIVTITGTNFNHASAVKFNGVPSVFILVNSTTITAKVESGTSSGPITVTTPGGTGSSANSFIVAREVFTSGINPVDGAAMVFVPGGNFTMGASDAEDGGIASNGETQQVTLTGYWIYTNEVTVAQYLAFLSANPNYISPYSGSHLPPWPGDKYSWANKSGWSDPAMQQMPIVNVSWYDARSYATWAGVSLPTEAQYEYASRGPAENNYPWGGKSTAADPDNGWDQTKCANWLNSADNNISTWPVGSFPAGASWCGAQDMAGNVGQWCADWYGDYSSTSVTNPIGPASGSYRVARSGTWAPSIDLDIQTNFYRGTIRGGGVPKNTGDNIGFRCVAAHFL